MSGGYGHNDAGDGRQKLKNTELSDGVDATTSDQSNSVL